MSRERENAGESEETVDSTTGQTRELTAADLAGTRPTTTRGRRRPRRTPSQVSTKSLPAYMKEPGDNEVVIYRYVLKRFCTPDIYHLLATYSGLEDMDEEPEADFRDENNPANTTTTTLGSARTGRYSHDDTHALLMPRAESPELMRHSLNLSRGSYDHNGSDESHAQLIDVQRGEAPPYETIDLNPTEEPVSTHRRQSSQSMRMPGFLSRFIPHRGNDNITSEPVTLSPVAEDQNHTFPPSHSRQHSSQSGVSGPPAADSHDSPRRSRVERTHRNNTSSTGSVFTVISRTLSRHPDDVPLTSPSMISLNSISGPLTHTATRTEFTFPRTGPTSEQVKFLSSKDTFGRFGLPYGPDALAFAASSSSRVDLPPDFNSIHRPSFGDLTRNPDDGSAGSSLRSTSARGTNADDNPDRGESPFPESIMEPSPDLTFTTNQSPPPGQRSSPEVDSLASLPQNPFPKQKSTPNLGVGNPPLLKSTLKSKSTANLQSGGGLPPRSTSAASSYLTVESFRTANGDEDDPVPSLSLGNLGQVPEITIHLPSNNPSLANVVEGSGSEPEEFFDGDEGSGSDSQDNIGRGGNKTSKTGQSNGGSKKALREGSPPSKSSASGNNNTGPRGVHTRSSSSSTSNSDNEIQMPQVHDGTDVTLTPEMVTLKTNSPGLAKMSRTTAIGA